MESNVIIFIPKNKQRVSQNIKDFINLAKEDLLVLGADLDFESDVWDVTKFVNLKGRGNTRNRAIFADFESRKTPNHPVYMAEPFKSFAKAYFRYVMGYEAVTNYQYRLMALRALYSVMRDMKILEISKLTEIILNRTVEVIRDGYHESSTAYGVSGQLAVLNNFLAENNLIEHSFEWRSQVKRKQDGHRVGKEFDEKRAKKMPSHEAMDAIAKIFRAAKTPRDIICSSIGAILFSAPSRISEVLELPVNCEVQAKMDEGYRYGLQWQPAKGAAPTIKYPLSIFQETVKEAIHKVYKATEPARQVARWYEKNPNKLFLPKDLEHLRGSERLTCYQVSLILGLQGGKNSARLTINNYKIPSYMSDKKSLYVKFSELEKIIVSFLPKSFPYIRDGSDLKFSEALFVLRKNELNKQRGVYNCLISSISVNSINSGFGTKHELGSSSIFSDNGFFMPDGSPIKLTTHQARHYLNTQMQMTGKLSQVEIAKWSGRKEVSQNIAYDHSSPEDTLRHLREAVGNSDRAVGPIAMFQNKTLIPRNKFAEMMIPVAHVTDIGYCVNDFSMATCEHHAACIKCNSSMCIKGEKRAIGNIEKAIEDSDALLARFQEAKNQEYDGADRWYEQEKLVNSMYKNLSSIMSDKRIPNGKVIHLAPQNEVNRTEFLSLGLDSNDQKREEDATS